MPKPVSLTMVQFWHDVLQMSEPITVDNVCALSHIPEREKYARGDDQWRAVVQMRLQAMYGRGLIKAIGLGVYEPTGLKVEQAQFRRLGKRPTMRDAERTQILETLREAGGNRAQTAEALGIDKATLYRKLSRYRKEGLDLEGYLMQGAAAQAEPEAEPEPERPHQPEPPPKPPPPPDPTTRQIRTEAQVLYDCMYALSKLRRDARRRVMTHLHMYVIGDPLVRALEDIGELDTDDVGVTVESNGEGKT